MSVSPPGLMVRLPPSRSMAVAQVADAGRCLSRCDIAVGEDGSRDADEADTGGAAAVDRVAGERQVRTAAHANASAVDVVIGEGGVRSAKDQDGALGVVDER